MYTKKGLPARGEFVLSVVKKEDGHSVFMSLEEYGGKEAMLHSSEIERSWLRKLKSKLKPGTKVVCQVMETGERGVSLSQRRVGAAQNRNKLTEARNERAADNILVFFGKDNKLSEAAVYKEIGNKILDKYGLLFPALLEISKGGDVMAELDVKKELAKKFVEFVRQRLKIPKKVMTINVEISTTNGEGINIIKKVFAEAAEIAKKHKIEFKVHYISAPKYQMTLVVDEYKAGERVLSEIEEKMNKLVEKTGQVCFKR